MQTPKGPTRPFVLFVNEYRRQIDPADHFKVTQNTLLALYYYEQNFMNSEFTDTAGKIGT